MITKSELAKKFLENNCTLNERIQSCLSVLSSFNEEREKLKLIPKKQRTKEQQSLLTTMKNKTVEKYIKDLKLLLEPEGNSSSLTLWELVHILQCEEGTIWNEFQRELWKIRKPTLSEGRGEASVKNWYGFPYDDASAKPIDIPELGIEIKNVQSTSGNSIQQLRSSGVYEVVDLIVELTEQLTLSMNGHSSTVEWTIEQKNIYQKIIKEHKVEMEELKIHFPEQYKKYFLPSIVFNGDKIKTLCCATNSGFLRIECQDFDEALTFHSIEKLMPKYDINEKYVVKRLKSKYASNDAANVNF